MDFYPLNLIMAVAVASATIFLGFLPTRNIRAAFFAREAIKAALAWVFIAMSSPPAIIHYPFFIAFFCFSSWWQLRRDKILSGKMWLSLASGLGISLGVVLLLAVTPRAYPPGLIQPTESLLLASIYTGGGVIGLAYVCYMLTVGFTNRSGVTQDLIQRYAGLLLGLVLVRAGVLLALFFYKHPLAANLVGVYLHDTFYVVPGRTIRIEVLTLLVLTVLIQPGLAWFARRAACSRTPSQGASVLAGICFVGILAETLARLLVL
jgi:hypothetical protein